MKMRLIPLALVAAFGAASAASAAVLDSGYNETQADPPTMVTNAAAPAVQTAQATADPAVFVPVAEAISVRPSYALLAFDGNDAVLVPAGLVVDTAYLLTDEDADKNAAPAAADFDQDDYGTEVP